MTSDLYQKLVDLYAAGELTDELAEAMDLQAYHDEALSRDMRTLKDTVDLLKSQPEPEFTEESYQRVLMKIYARGGDIQTQAPDPAHMQYHLPIQG